MCTEYVLERRDFYRFLQVQHYYVKEGKWMNREEPLSVIQMFIKAYNSESTRQIIITILRDIIEEGTLNGLYKA